MKFLLPFIYGYLVWCCFQNLLNPGDIMAFGEIKRENNFFVDWHGRKFKTREAAKYLNAGECWMYNSGRADLYDWHHRYLLMTKGIGYIKMASELEPYNP